MYCNYRVIVSIPLNELAIFLEEDIFSRLVLISSGVSPATIVVLRMPPMVFTKAKPWSASLD